MDRSAEPVNAWVSTNCLVLGINKNYFKIFVNWVLCNPVGVQNPQRTTISPSTLLDCVDVCEFVCACVHAYRGGEGGGNGGQKQRKNHKQCSWSRSIIVRSPQHILNSAHQEFSPTSATERRLLWNLSWLTPMLVGLPHWAPLGTFLFRPPLRTRTR